jgi:branched-chain amino acid transport system substrate-binding protein
MVLPQRVPAQPKSAEPYRFGASMVTSGSDAEYVTKYMIQGILDAVEEINAQGGIKGRPIKLILEDTKADPSTGAMVTKKLISVD